MCILMPAWSVFISHVQHARPEDRTCVCTSRCGLSTTLVGSSMIWLTYDMCTHLWCWIFFLFLANFGVLVQFRILGKQRRLLSTSSYQRPRGTWRMCLDTNKLFPSAGFVVGLAERHKLSHGSLMDRDGGQWSQSRFCLACWRMQRAMLRYCLCCPEYFLFIVHNCGAWYDVRYLPRHCLLSFGVGEKVYTQCHLLCFVGQTVQLTSFWLQVKGLDVDTLFISHIQVNKAQKQRRRTYRAHGRINRMSSLSPLLWSWFWCKAMSFEWYCISLQILQVVNFIIVIYCWGHADSVVGILVDCNLDLLVEANGTGGVSGVLQPTCHLHAILSLLSQRRRWLSRKRWGFWLVFIFIEVIIWELWNLLYFLIVIKGLTWLVVIAPALSALLDKYCCIGEITLQ
jgi:hypothetical protein